MRSASGSSRFAGGDFRNSDFYPVSWSNGSGLISRNSTARSPWLQETSSWIERERAGIPPATRGPLLKKNGRRQQPSPVRESRTKRMVGILRVYGRAIVMTGEVQVSQSAGLVASPNAFNTESLST